MLAGRWTWENDRSWASLQSCCCLCGWLVGLFLLKRSCVVVEESGKHNFQTLSLPVQTSVHCQSKLQDKGILTADFWTAFAVCQSVQDLKKKKGCPEENILILISNYGF